ncbi:MAG: hypothetical protein HON98_01945 [Chloroflexi bacterium]|jgi:L-serine kinase (ATP) / ParB family transcriptional regulator, heme-responsive regulator|nr:hypothetical protein [Chloroflexota bacterium]MBT3670850.1 hypothetical protein [Chloroflexota bacterium]MBT4004326.1 hypothetical protein [Chloroflexota bacterium]MBT4305309.1 hypothetical protein [Chloroflexota bacterium]MBT4532455.1 hypothetical protein [Chloroflexota bacterium]
MLDSLPNLQIISLDNLVVHEFHDNQRTPPLIKSLRASGKLKNPPIVTPFEDNSGRYMVMDGANRTIALQQMGFPHVLAQVVESDAPGLEMQSWNHVIWGMPTQGFLDLVGDLPDLKVYPMDDQEDALRQLWNQKILIYIQTPEKKVYVASTEKDKLEDRVDLLHQVMDVYKNAASLDRTRVRKISPLLELYHDLTALLVYPPFEVPEVIKMCGKGHLFPAGITRFIVAPRALRVNYSLEKMESKKSLAIKNEELQKWLKEKMGKKGVRFYLEPTVLYDE